MKIRLLLFIATCFAVSSSGQSFIKGRVKDRQQNLSSATVLLLNPDSALVKAVATDKSGEFSFENIAPGNYIVSSSVIGYSRFFSQVIPVEQEEIILPDIILERLVTELNGVVIKAKKPLIEQQIDRLVVNVQSSATSSGNTVLDILQKTPGVVINRQNNTIAMNGKAGVRIMMNEKLLQLPLDVVFQMLEGMSASNIEKIELITAPPAKYDAEGNAGIIHIVMKGSADLGTNGSFGLTLGYKWAENLGINFNLNHRNARFAYFIDYSGTRDHNLHLLNLTRRSVDSGFVKTVNDFSHRENVTTQQNLNSGLELKLTSKTFLRLSMTAYRRNWDLTAFTNDTSHKTVDSTIITNMNIHESNIWQSATGGIGLETKMNSRSSLTLNLDYLYYHNSNPSDYNVEALVMPGNVNEASIIDLTKLTPIHFLVAAADYQYSYSPSLLMEAGIKATRSDLTNDVVVRRLTNNVSDH